jgi:hypothetical protein
MLRVSIAVLLVAAVARADVSMGGPGAPVRTLETHALVGPLADADDFCSPERPRCTHGGLWNWGDGGGHDFIEGAELEARGRHVLALRTRSGWWLDEHVAAVDRDHDGDGAPLCLRLERHPELRARLRRGGSRRIPSR